MHQLQKKDLPKFQERFVSFYDAVVRHVSFSYESNHFRVIIEAQDSSEERQPCWRLVTLIMEGCFSMRVSFGFEAYYVLSPNGLNILFENNEIGLDFGRFDPPPESMKELLTSPFHVAGRKLFWIDAACPIMS